MDHRSSGVGSPSKAWSASSVRNRPHPEELSGVSAALLHKSMNKVSVIGSGQVCQRESVYLDVLWLLVAASF